MCADWCQPAGCYCNEGYYRVDKECVPKEKCPGKIKVNQYLLEKMLKNI